MAEATKSRWSNAIINLFILLVTVIICLALAEVWVRVFRSDSIAPGLWPEGNAQFVPGLRKNVYLNISNLTKATSEFSYTISTNQYGFRDFHDFENEAGTKRIVAVGASSLFGNTVEADETYLSVLGERLGVETINLGLGGNGFNEMKYILKEYGIKYNPDLILVEVELGNLYADNLFEKRAETRQRQSLFMWVYGHSKAVSHFYWQAKTTPFGFEIIQLLGLNKHGQDSNSFDFDLLQHKDTAPINNSKVSAFKNIREIKAIADERNIPLLLIYIPPAFQTNQEKLKEIIREYSLDSSQVDMVVAEKFYMAVARKLNIPFFNPTEELVKAAQEKTLDWTYDGHFNSYGNQVYAALLADFIRDKKMLEAYAHE